MTIAFKYRKKPPKDDTLTIVMLDGIRKRQAREIEELKACLRLYGPPACRHLSHPTKREQHELFERCPMEARIRKALET